MSDFPDTRDSLIVDVKDPSNRIAWEEFTQTYRPVIYRIARTRGLQDSDAQDLAQRVLMSIARGISRWEKDDSKTRFRNWLSRVTRNAIINALTRQPRDLPKGGSSTWDLLSETPDSDEQTVELIGLEYRRELYRQASSIVRNDVNESTWKAFELTVVHGATVDHAAEQLGQSKGSVYAGRSRVMRRLCETVEQLERSRR